MDFLPTFWGPSKSKRSRLRDGRTLLYLNRLGGGGATAVATNGAGNVYVAGGTSSPDFPTTSGAWNTVYDASAQEAFVVKLDPSGKVVYSTLLGGTDYTAPWDIAVNASGEAFVTGLTIGGDFPVVGSSIPSPYVGLVPIECQGVRGDVQSLSCWFATVH